MRRFDGISIHEMPEDMVLEREGSPPTLLDTLFLKGEEETITDVTTTSGFIQFRYALRKCVSCGERIKKDLKLIVTDHHYVTSCYSCEKWNIFNRISLIPSAWKPTEIEE
jgi:hypothetical protein